ncbi:MAG: adenylate/guanylate cyclase domain-containing protein [Saprospiraceae bacterium]
MPLIILNPLDLTSPFLDKTLLPKVLFNMKPFKLIYIFIALGWHLSIAQSPVVLSIGEDKLIGKNISFYVDESHSVTVDEVSSKTFIPCETDVLNLGHQEHPVWIRFQVTNRTDQSYFLQIEAPMLEELEVYQVEDAKFNQLFKGGFNTAFTKRPIKIEDWLFSLQSNKDAPTTYYIRAYTGFPFLLPISIASKNEYVGRVQQHNLFWGLYVGIMVFAFLYNLFIYFSVREKTYLYYILYILGASLFYLGLQGFDFKYLWPDLPSLNKHVVSILCFTNICITAFAFRFLGITKKSFKWQYYFGIFLAGMFGLLFILDFLLPYGLVNGLAQLFSLVICVYFITLGVMAYRNKISNARYFLFAWTLFLLLAMLYILTINNVFPSNFFTTHSIFIGHMTEVLLLSFALADRINFLKKENEEKQSQIIYQLEENEKIQLRANKELEQKVVTRTAEVVKQKNEAENARARSEELLLNILPAETAEELKATGTSDAKLISEATVLFVDIKDFSSIASTLSPDELVNEINECFTEFDMIVEKYGIEKIKTIGDAYMAVGGVPKPNHSNPDDVVNAAFEMLDFISKLNQTKISEGRKPFNIRIGVNTGQVVAGIVGVKKFAYDIWGDTVNIASRMESLGVAGKINISESTYHRIKGHFECTHRGKIDAKNIGSIDMYFVDKKKHFHTPIH